MRSSAGVHPFFAAVAFAVLAGVASFAEGSGNIVFVVIPQKDVNPFHIAPDFKGGVWITDRQHGTVDHLTGDVNGDGIADIVVRPPTEAGTLATPESIATAPNGNVVFTYNTTGLDGSPIDSRIGFFNAASPKNVLFIRMPPTPGVVASQDTCANADCPLALTGDGTQAWVIEQNVDVLDLLSLNTSAMAFFKLPAHGYPVAVAAAPDGSAYVAEYFPGLAGSIEKVSLSAPIEETLFPSFSGGDRPQRLAFNIADNLLYIGTSADGLVTMSPSQQFSRTPLTTTSTQIAALTAGPDGDLWFVGFQSKTIGQWMPPAGPMNQTALADAPGDVAISGTTLYYVGYPPGSFDGNLHKGMLASKKRPRLAEFKTHSQIVPAGSAHVRITYTITLTNTGDDSTHPPLFVYDPIPLGDIVEAPSSCMVKEAIRQPAAILECLVGASLDPGRSTSVTFTAEVPVPGGGAAIENYATYDGGGAGKGESNLDVYTPAKKRRSVNH